tara:strand:- start:122 stop:505 length:384 start_codon:yes stop_codon:yes gene_type:complete
MPSILITDDEESILEYFEDVLSDMGLDVYAARDGQEALEMLENLQPDLMLVDLMMPKVDGIQLIETIRKADKKIPVIVVSGTEDDRKKAAAKSKGANVVLPKPLDLSEFENTIWQLLDNQRLIEDHF